MAEPVLLTGATGCVGRAVLAGLRARGIPVHAVSRNPGPALPEVRWHRADLLAPEGRAAVAECAPCLIHCAWEVDHATFWTSSANAAWQAASLDLVRRFRAAGGQRVVALGTCAEYDPWHDGPWNEDRPLRPHTAYGQAKAALWRALADLCGADLVWARLFHLFGPGEDPRRFVPSIILRLAAKERAVVRAPQLIRDYAAAEDIGHCLVQLIDAPLCGACDIGGGHPASLGDLATTIADALGAGHLLDLSPDGKTQDPARMVPELHRLRTGLSPAFRTPAEALPALIRRLVSQDRASGVTHGL